MSVAAMVETEGMARGDKTPFLQMAELESAAPPLEAALDEEYAHSMSTIRRLGEAAILGLESFDRRRELAFDDFSTAVVEMINSDKEYGKLFDVETERFHGYSDGHVTSRDGKPMVDLVADGAEASRKKADANPLYEGQAMRDACDAEVAAKVDQLRPGETLLGISMAPLHDLRKHRSTYRKLGYAELLYLQAYTRVDEEVFVVFSYSADASNARVWREVAANHDITIPDDESDNTWLRHTVVLDMDEAQARQQLRTMRREYYQTIGEDKQRYSATEYTEQHETVMRDIFDQYYLPLSEAGYTQQNNDVLKSFATQLLGHDIAQLEPGIRRQLIRIANMQGFDDEAAKAVDKVIRFAAAEQLRKGLDSFMTARHQGQPIVWSGVKSMASAYDPSLMHQMIAQNVEVGAIARREYLGCAGNVSMTTDASLSEKSSDRNPQEAYGGRTDSEEAGGKKLMSCPHCQAIVYDDPCAARLKCWDCGALVVNGKVKSTGDGGSKAREARREAERAERAQAEAAKGQEKETVGETGERSENVRVQHIAQLALAA